MINIALALSIILFSRAYGESTRCPPSVSSVQSLLDRAFMAGAAIVVVDKTGVIYDQAFGYDTPLFPSQRRLIDTSESIFLLASISKTFISVAAMQLVESNHLVLDTDINQYLSPVLNVVHPQYPNIPITMRHLLMHSSGIGINAGVELESYTIGDTFIQTSLAEVLKKYFLGNESWLPIPPGKKTSYSNPGTNLAALVIERLVGIRFDEYVQQRILKPLGITEKMGGFRLGQFHPNSIVHNYIYNESLSAQLNVFLNHFNASQNTDSRWIHIPLHGSSLYASGYLRMSAKGLARFLQAFLNDFSILFKNASSIVEILRVPYQESYSQSSSTKYSLIWNWIEFGGRRFVGHQGSLLGATNLMLANENRSLGAILLTTGDISTATNHTVEAGNTMVTIMTQLFDCFERRSPITSGQNVVCSSITLMVCLLNFSFYGFSILL